jgi:nuclease HARBI1
LAVVVDACRFAHLIAGQLTTSLRRWNSAFERTGLRQLEAEAARAIELAIEIEFGSDASVSSTSSSKSSSSSSSSSSSFDAIAAVLPLLANIAGLRREIYSHVEDESIQFGRRLVIQDFTPSQCLEQFRFRKVHLYEFANALWPRIEPYFDGDKSGIICEGYNVPYETCLLLYLARLSFPRRLVADLESMFGMRKSSISASIRTFSGALYRVSIQYLDDPSIWRSRMPLYAERIGVKSGNLVPNIWGFLDATIRRTRRPSRFQRRMYTGYRRCHALKYQSVVTPDGYIAVLHGPYTGSHHDARIFNLSGLQTRLEEIMPRGVGLIYSLYADWAYSTTVWVMTGVRAAEAGGAEALFNAFMSSCRIAVEWGFKDILRLWKFLDFHPGQQVLKIPLGQYFINAGFLTNIHNCFYGSQASNYFECRPLTLDQYLSLVDPA